MGENGKQLTSLSLLGLGALLPLLCIAQNARADAEDLLSVTTSIAVKHDDNLFRLADDAAPPASLGTTQKSDDITTAALTLKLGPASLGQPTLRKKTATTIWKDATRLSVTWFPAT